MKYFTIIYYYFSLMQMTTMMMMTTKKLKKMKVRMTGMISPKAMQIEKERKKESLQIKSLKISKINQRMKTKLLIILNPIYHRIINPAILANIRRVQRRNLILYLTTVKSMKYFYINFSFKICFPRIKSPVYTAINGVFTLILINITMHLNKKSRAQQKMSN